MADSSGLFSSIKDARRRLLARRVPLDRLLLGPDVARDEWEYAEKTGDWLHTSTRLADGPHVALLRAVGGPGSAEPTDEFLRSTPYYRQAERCVRAFGRFFDAADGPGILRQMRGYIALYRGRPDPSRSVAPGRSRAASLPIIKRIQGSGLFSVRDGHHRLGIAIARGERTARVYVKTRRALTSVQRLILEVESTKHRPALYQPVPLPEMGPGWPLRRQCADRWRMMTGFMRERGIESADGALSAVDVACNYGWFVGRYKAAGLRAFGVDLDPAALRVGKAVYGLGDQDLEARDAVDFLRGVTRPYDIVSCFSLAHHFVLGRGPCPAEELMRLLDHATGRVLFFDTGQEHERWFREKLAGWDEQRVARWLREATTFREIVRLGTDHDDVGVTAENYRRTLFALVR